MTQLPPSTSQPEGPDAIHPESAGEWRAWLELNHLRLTEVFVHFWKKGHGPASALSRGEADDEALCFGWTAAGGRSLGLNAIAVRFARRRPGSNWSPTNLTRARRLIREGRMTEAGRTALPTDLA